VSRRRQKVAPVVIAGRRVRPSRVVLLLLLLLLLAAGRHRLSLRQLLLLLAGWQRAEAEVLQLLLQLLVRLLLLLAAVQATGFAQVERVPVVASLLLRAAAAGYWPGCCRHTNITRTRAIHVNHVSPMLLL
jgi:hypothetical protein